MWQDVLLGMFRDQLLNVLILRGRVRKKRKDNTLNEIIV